MSELKEALLRYRIKNHLTQIEMSKKLGISLATYNKLENDMPCREITKIKAKMLIESEEK